MDDGQQASSIPVLRDAIKGLRKIYVLRHFNKMESKLGVKSKHMRNVSRIKALVAGECKSSTKILAKHVRRRETSSASEY
jgi:hypothetical protein